MKTVVLLINLGTPDSPKTSDVRRYLSEFLNDKRVIDLPWLWRKLLVNLIIVPFRAPKSAKLYKELWTPAGSPLIINTEKLKDALQTDLGDNYEVEMAMRYGKPSLRKVLRKIEERQPQRIILAPLYPQYASSTTGSTIERTVELIGNWKQVPEVKMIHHFHDNPGFIEAFVSRIKQYRLADYDHIIMSYHGLPVNHVTEAHGGRECEALGCTEKRHDENYYCYLASCYETSRLLAEQLNLNGNDYTVCFQSRLSKNWLTPFTDEVVHEQAELGHKRLLVISPAFVADCLETTHELGKELKEEFEQGGGEELSLVESLNNLPQWVETMAGMIRAVDLSGESSGD
jgi:protoporphyrin/coproporphyrin ferrochelatase